MPIHLKDNFLLFQQKPPDAHLPLGNRLTSLNWYDWPCTTHLPSPTHHPATLTTFLPLGKKSISHTIHTCHLELIHIPSVVGEKLAIFIIFTVLLPDLPPRGLHLVFWPFPSPHLRGTTNWRRKDTFLKFRFTFPASAANANQRLLLGWAFSSLAVVLRLITVTALSSFSKEKRPPGVVILP